MPKPARLTVATTVGLLVVSVSSALALNLGFLAAGEGTPSQDAAAGVTDATAVDPGGSATPGARRVITVFADDTAGTQDEPSDGDDQDVADSQPPAPTVGSAASQVSAPSGVAPAAPSAPPVAPGSSGGASSPAPPPSSPAPTSTPVPPAPATPTPAPPPPTATPAPTVVPTTVPTAVPTPTPPPASASYPTYEVPGVATVTLQYVDGAISVWSVQTTTGWVYRLDRNGPREVKVAFARMSGGEVRGEAAFKAQLEGSRIAVEQEVG